MLPICFANSYSEVESKKSILFHCNDSTVHTRTLNFHCNMKTNKFRFEKGFFCPTQIPYKCKFTQLIVMLCEKVLYIVGELSLYSETGFHIGMDNNCVCLWRRHNCKSQVIDLSFSALVYEINYWVFKQFYLHATISASLKINLH
jgi:hypothetical protein